MLKLVTFTSSCIAVVCNGKFVSRPSLDTKVTWCENIKEQIGNSLSTFLTKPVAHDAEFTVVVLHTFLDSKASSIYGISKKAFQNPRYMSTKDGKTCVAWTKP